MKRMIPVVLGVLFVSSVAFAQDEDEHKKPGGKFAVTAYETDRTTVVTSAACEVRYVAKYPIAHCKKTWRKVYGEMQETWCKSHPGQQWFLQIGNRGKLSNHCKK